MATWLHIGEHETEIGTAVLGTGAAALFRHDPPTPLEIENAIEVVEDEIARVHAQVPRGSRLYTRDAMVRDIALAAGVPPGPEMTLAIEAVEQAFALLPRHSGGKERAAVLLILRELMHHLGFAEVSWKA